MNDEAPSTSASSAAIPNYSDDFSTHPQQASLLPQRLSASQIELRRKKNRQNFNKRRAHLLEDLIRNLDVVVYCELGVGYYMEYVLHLYIMVWKCVGCFMLISWL